MAYMELEQFLGRGNEKIFWVLSLKDLGGRLQPASGWSFRAVTLEQDLVLTSDGGDVRITQDELGNTYDRAGGPFSNYKP